MATLVEINLKVDRILAEISETNARQRVHIESHVSTDKRLEHVEKVIDGNGKEGLDDRVKRIEQALKWIAWALGIIGVGVLGDLGTRIASAIFK